MKTDLAKFKKELASITVKIGKQRDGLRASVEELSCLVDSVTDADDSMNLVMSRLTEANEILDREVVDKLSEYA